MVRPNSAGNGLEKQKDRKKENRTWEWKAKWNELTWYSYSLHSLHTGQYHSTWHHLSQSQHTYTIRVTSQPQSPITLSNPTPDCRWCYTSSDISSAACAVYLLMTCAAAIAGTLIADSSVNNKWLPRLSSCQLKQIILRYWYQLRITP